MIKMADLILPLIGFVAGIAIMIKASDYAVEKALEFSKITGMMKLSVGMIIIGTMTSLPEFSIAMASSLAGANKIMFSNLIGGSFTDLFFVMGIGAVLYGLKISKEDLEKGTQIFVLTSLLLTYGLVYGFDSTFGILSVLAFLLLSERLMAGKRGENRNSWRDLKGGFFILLKITVAVAAIIFAAEIITYSTKVISSGLGITETLIGATVIALSTTTPELFVTIAAGKRNEFDLLVGNLFGSCFVNIVLILGLSTIIAPFYPGITDVVLLASIFGAYFTVYLFSASRQIDRYQGIIMVSMYALYLGIMLAIA